MTGKWRTPEQRIAAAQAKIARAQHQVRKKERGDDLRRKILLGAWLQSQMEEKGPEWSARLLADLGQYLTRPIDRALFGLPLEPPPEVTPKPPS